MGEAMPIQAGEQVPAGESLPEGVRIRPMAAADVDPVLAIERTSETAPHWGMAAYTRNLEDSGASALRRVALVAEVNGAVAGLGMVRILAAPDGGEAELETIVVAAEWRRRGIGAALMRGLLDSARVQGARRLYLEVRASNSAAIGLYRRLGMEETGRRRGYYRDPEEDALLMDIGL
jgi:[ribosomal protein S18]-alanine N-acetyltransferase